MASRKNKNTQAKSTPSGDELISVEEVWNFLAFADSLYRGTNGVFTPMLVNQRMQDVTMNPLQATADGIDAALQSPKSSGQALVGYSEFMELSSMLYKRVLGYFSGLLEFNFTYVCTNADAKDYSSPAYKKDLKVVEEFFDKFDYKNEFRTAIKQMLRQEAFFGIFRDDGNYRYVIQELPQNRCLITGRWEMGLLYDFDMMWFLSQVGVSLDMYPPIFTTMFNRAFGDQQHTELYNPSLSINNRDSNWVYYVQTSPKDNFWCFKLYPEIATIIPFLSPYMKDVILQDMVRALQKDLNIAQASKLVGGQVPFLKDTKASVKDQISLTPDTLGKFLQLVKSGLPSAIKVISAPLEELKGIEFKGDNDMYDSYLKTTAGVSGINSRLIYSYDRQNLLETKLSMDIDVNVLRPVLTQFQNFLEYFVNQRTKTFKFKFFLEGFNTSLDRDERLKTVQQYADNGIILEQKWAAAIGLNPFDLRRMMAETKAIGFVEKLTPILKANQMPAGGASSGRPQKSESDLSEAGAQSRNDGSNLESSEE